MSTIKPETSNPLIAGLNSSLSQVWVLSWSQQQQVIHIETLEQMLKLHADAFATDHELQYVPLMFGDRQLLDREYQKLRPGLLKRRELKLEGREGSIPWSEVKDDASDTSHH